MKTYVTLLRGINVSGQKKIKMADLKSLYEVLGFEEVVTYIQSGNVIFRSEVNNKKELNSSIVSAIEKNYGFIVPVLVLDVEELMEVFLNNPFILGGVDDVSRLHVTLLDEIPEGQLVDSLNSLKSGEDEFKIIENRIYINCPNGYGRTKFTNTLFERKLKVRATTRNWKTITKLVEMIR